jgi:hypothetical protein
VGEREGPSSNLFQAHMEVISRTLSLYPTNVMQTHIYLNYTCFPVSLTECCSVATVSIALGNMQCEFWSGGHGVMINDGILCFFYSLRKTAEVGMPHFHPQHFQFTYIYCTLIPLLCIINEYIL